MCGTTGIQSALKQIVLNFSNISLSKKYFHNNYVETQLCLTSFTKQLLQFICLFGLECKKNQQNILHKKI